MDLGQTQKNQVFKQLASNASSSYHESFSLYALIEMFWKSKIIQIKPLTDLTGS